MDSCGPSCFSEYPPLSRFLTLISLLTVILVFSEFRRGDVLGLDWIGVGVELSSGREMGGWEEVWNGEEERKR
jgi:hypothetical protein